MDQRWQEIQFEIDGKDAELASEILTALEAAAVTTRARDDQPDWLDLAEPVRPAWQRVWVTALFAAELDLVPIVEHLVREGVVSSARDVECRSLEDRVWEREWMTHFHPFEVTPGLWIVPSHAETPADADQVITLDPGLAFGTGTHPTTAMCLSALAANDLTDKAVLDYGCGSGILAIGALKRGARRAVAVDVDPKALEATRENARTNGVLDRLTVCQPTELTTDYLAELVIANILADTLVKLSNELAAHLSPGGQVLLSGILLDQADDVVRHFGCAWRFEKEARDDWVMLSGQRLR